MVDKFLLQLEEQLGSKGVRLTVDEDARIWLADNGFDIKMGARPMARVIQENIKRPLAEELLFGKLSGGGRVVVSVTDGALSFEIESREQIAQLEIA